MRNKLLFFAVLCAYQGALTMVAAQEPNQSSSQKQIASSPAAQRVNGIAEWFRRTAMTLQNMLADVHLPSRLGQRTQQIAQQQIFSDIDDVADYFSFPKSNPGPDEMLQTIIKEHSDSCRNKAIAFLLLNHDRCGSKSPFFQVLPMDVIQQICNNLKESMKELHCKWCDFTFFEPIEFFVHLQSHHFELLVQEQGAC